MALPGDFKDKLIAAMQRASSTSVDGLSVSNRSANDLIKLYEFAVAQDEINSSKRRFRLDYFRPGGAIHSVMRSPS